MLLIENARLVLVMIVPEIERLGACVEPET